MGYRFCFDDLFRSELLSFRFAFLWKKRCRADALAFRDWNRGDDRYFRAGWI